MRSRRILATLFDTMVSPHSSKVRTSNSHVPTPTASGARAYSRTVASAGSNWKALKKTLESEAPPANNRLNKKRKLGNRPSQPHASSIDKGKARQMDSPSNGNGNSSASPAPTSLPWFAEDLSPEDLALVRNLNLQPDTRPGASGQSQWTAWDAQRGTDEQEQQKKRIILGGHWDGPENAAKKEPGTYVAIDCEMVGVGPKGSESVLARVSIVNWHGYTLLDRFVKPKEQVTDYRTFVSGIRAKDLRGAPSFDAVQLEVAEMIKGRVLVGHAIQNDLKAILLDHPRRMIRDTATFQPLRDLAQTKFPGLRKLATIVLGIDIQKKGQEHSSVEDARTTMAIFRTQKEAWEKSLRDAHVLSEKRLARKANKLGKDADPNEEPKTNGTTTADAASSPAASRPAKRKTNQATPNWWTQGDW